MVQPGYSNFGWRAASAEPLNAAVRWESARGCSDVGQDSSRQPASPSEVIYGHVAGARAGKLSPVPSCLTKRLLDLLDEHRGLAERCYYGVLI